MAEPYGTDGLLKSARRADILNNLGIIASLVAVALGGTGYYSVQQAYTDDDATRLEARLLRLVDHNERTIERHAHEPHREVDARLRTLEVELAALRAKYADHHEGSARHEH